MRGFTLLGEDEVPELSARARLWMHEATRAPLLSFCNADENKVFGVSLRTPSGDSTGVAHILEHSVLCGSEKYPVKEPFVELLKGSLHTFLNAFTYPDKTCYPVASANLKDFYNLIDVYLDAVFFPRISAEIFAQEGWRLENSPQGRIIKGVVYNEMKGAFSSPDSVLERHTLHALFPDTVYAGESGGDPADIPSLSYADFRAFHSRFYHPSNARFFFWGDDPEEARLQRLSALLERFDGPLPPPAPAIDLQKPLAGARRLSVPFAVSAGEDADKGMVTLNWLGPEAADVETSLGFRMLEHILLGLPASPLRRALIESGLGEDLAGQGLEDELRQLCFSVGLKGVSPAQAARVEEIILSVLEDLRGKGVPADAAEAALNSVEFTLRENNSGRFPLGLSIMLRALTTWLHDGDPLAPLRFEAHLAKIRTAVETGSGYFEKLIGKWLLDNPHRVTVILEPDENLQDRLEREEKERIAALETALSEAEQKEAEELVGRLRKIQEEPDAPGDLALIPRLSLADLPGDNMFIPTEKAVLRDMQLYFHPLPTRGVIYAQAAFDLGLVPNRLLPLLPLFCRALLEMGTARRGFVDLNMLIARKTGGLSADTLFLTPAPDKEGRSAPRSVLLLSGKAAPDKVADLFDLMAEVLAEADFSDRELFLRMALEEKARLEQGLVPAGHMAVASRLRAALSPAGRMEEAASGLSALPYLRAIKGKIEADEKSLFNDLETLRALILHRAGLSLNVTALPEQRGQVLDLLPALAARLPAEAGEVAGATGPAGSEAGDFGARAARPAEALLVPAQVNYVGKAMNLFDAGYAYHGSALVILRHLRAGYLWDRVRVRGGAYGCFCSLERFSGALVMVSYRDPNIASTLEVFDQAAADLARNKPGRAELEKAVIGAIGEIDAYLRPDAKGETAFVRELRGDSEELRARLRAEVLATGPKDFADFADALADFKSRGIICALGGAALERLAGESGWTLEKIL